MSESEKFCSDCAWPYECAEQKSCKRRDRGDVRARVWRTDPVPFREFDANPPGLVILKGSADTKSTELVDEVNKQLSQTSTIPAALARGRSWPI